MDRRKNFHRLARAFLRFYPVRVGCAWLNNRRDRFFAADDPLWMLAPARGQWPAMMLDVSVHLQPKFFYFPRRYGRFYGGGTFASYIHEKLAPGGRFLDIGANVGCFSPLASRLVGPTGRVFALSFHRAKDGTANSLVAEAPGREGRYERTITTPVATRRGRRRAHRRPIRAGLKPALARPRLRVAPRARDAPPRC